MNFDEFYKLYEKVKDSNRFDQEYIKMDNVVTDEEIMVIENSIGVILPNDYKDFCRALGGGYFGLALIFSLDRQSDFFIEKQMKDLSGYLTPGYIPISDDQTGGFYCFKIENNKASSEIYYIDELGVDEEVCYPDFLTFVSKRAFE